MRLRLSSSRQPYRRGGLKIGPKHAPTLLEPGDVRPGSLLALLRDPVVTIAREVGEDFWETPGAAERAEAAEHLQAAIAVEELREKEALAGLAGELLAGPDGEGSDEGNDGPSPAPEPDEKKPVDPEPEAVAKPAAASGRKPRPAKAARG